MWVRSASCLGHKRALQRPYSDPTATLQRPYNDPTTTLQRPYKTLQVTLQRPYTVHQGNASRGEDSAHSARNGIRIVPDGCSCNTYRHLGRFGWRVETLQRPYSDPTDPTETLQRPYKRPYRDPTAYFYILKDQESRLGIQGGVHTDPPKRAEDSAHSARNGDRIGRGCSRWSI